MNWVRQAVRYVVRYTSALTKEEKDSILDEYLDFLPTIPQKYYEEVKEALRVAVRDNKN
jgi:hypothetical protein